MSSNKLVYDMRGPLKKSNPRDLAMLRIMEYARKRSDVYYVCSDRMNPGILQVDFKNEFPDRVYDLGIAESDCVGAASGIAICGNIVFVQTLGPFLSTRVVDQIHLDAAYNNVPVRFMGTHSGLSSGGGPTHYTLIDYAIMSAIPNLAMVSPCDGDQFVKLIDASMEYPAHIYIRFPYTEIPDIYQGGYDYAIGRAVTAKEGADAAVISCGSVMFESLKAAQELEEEGMSVRVIDMHTISPLDVQAAVDAAKNGCVVTAEEHSVVGGLGSAVASAIL